MKSVCVALALAGSASAFMAPMANVRATSTRSMSMATDQPMSRAEVINSAFATAGAALAAAAVMPTPAFADGAKSASTQARARGIYGTRLEGLKSAVDKGDAAAVLAEKNAFILFNSGVYSTDKAKFAKASDLAQAVIVSANAGDVAGLKKAYSEYMKYTVVKSGYATVGDGQGFGSEFDYKNRTPLGTVYQR